MANGENVGDLVVRLRAENKELLSALKESEKGVNGLLKEIARSNGEIEKSNASMNSKMQKQMDATARKVKTKTRTMADAFKSMSTIAGGFIQAQLMMRLAAVPGQLINSTKEAVLAYDRIQLRLRFVMKSAEAAQTAFRDLDAVTRKYGVSLQASAQFYSSFLAATDATNISLAQSKELFLGTTQAAVALQMTTDQTKASFRAFQQMASKGRVAAEELRGQLGEALPGALGIAARSMNMPIEQLSKIMEKGELLAEDLLPAMGRELQRVFSGSALDASETLLANLNRIENSSFQLLAGFGKDHEGILTPALKYIDEFLVKWHFWRASTGDISNNVLGDMQAIAVAAKQLEDSSWQASLKRVDHSLFGGFKNTINNAINPDESSDSVKAQEELMAVISRASMKELARQQRYLAGLDSRTKVEQLILDTINEEYDTKIFIHNEMQKALALGYKMNASEKEGALIWAGILGMHQEVYSLITQMETEYADIEKHNVEAANAVARIQEELGKEASFKQMNQFERINFLTKEIEATAKKITETNADDFASLRTKREALAALIKEYTRLYRLRQREADREAVVEKSSTYTSATVDTSAIDNRVRQQSELEKLQEEWTTIADAYQAYRDEINTIFKDSEAEREAEMTRINKQEANARKAFQMAQARVQLQTASTLFGDLTSIAQTFAGEQSGIYKSMFLASKAFAIADALISIQQGMAAALKLGFPLGLGAMASVAAAGASIASNMQSISMASFEGGGFTGRGDRVGGMDGKGGRMAMLHPNEKVTDLTRNKGGSGMTVIVNNLPGQDADTFSSVDGKTMEITIKRTKQEIASEIQRGAGSINKALDVRDRRTGARK